MARRSRSIRRPAVADPRFGNETVSRFVNYLMIGGKKSVARNVVYSALDMVEEKTKENPMEVFEKAMRNVSPSLEVKGRRVGGANYQVPFEVKGHRRMMLAFRWLIAAARSKKGAPMSERLARELVEASRGEGAAMKKREDVQKMAEANRAFAHFAR